MQVEQAARLLANAKKPVLVIGSQATLPPVPPLKLQEVVEQLNIPCFLAGMARGLVWWRLLVGYACFNGMDRMSAPALQGCSGGSTPCSCGNCARRP